MEKSKYISTSHCDDIYKNDIEINRQIATRGSHYQCPLFTTCFGQLSQLQVIQKIQNNWEVNCNIKFYKNKLDLIFFTKRLIIHNDSRFGIKQVFYCLYYLKTVTPAGTCCNENRTLIITLVVTDGLQ